MVHVVAALKDIARRVIGPRFLVRRLLKQELRHGEPELAALPLLCDPARSFVDVGANRGVYSYHARHFCDHVYALEAHPALIAPLGRILGTRGTVLHLAASNEEGTARLTIPFKNGRELDTRSSLEADANPGFDLQSIEVETRRIDGLGLGPVGVVKIDVEGHEHAVLEGAEETLLRDKPIVIVECEERHHVGGVERTFGFFDRLGYDGYFLQREVLRSARDFDAAAMQDIAKASSGSVRTGEYINNFIFIHPTDTQRLSLLKTRYR